MAPERQEGAQAIVRTRITANSFHQSVQGVLKYTKYKSGYIRGTPQGFCDSSGHGVGLEIHVNPSVSKKIALKAGKMITIEPGICFGGIGGVRMEDVVFVRAKGFEFLAPRKLGWSL